MNAGDRRLEPNRKILIVEDDPLLNQLLLQTLARKGFATISAASGETGLALVKCERPCCIISDYSMPGMSGAQFIDRVRAADRNVPVLLITGNLSEENIIDLMRFDCFAAIYKPFTSNELLAGIEHVFSLRCSAYPPRIAYRVEVVTPVKLDKIGSASTLNLSTHGAFVVTDQVIQAGMTLELRFETMKPFTVQGDVVWLRASRNALPAGLGLRFKDIDEEARHALKNLLFREIKKTNRGWLNFSSKA